MNDLEIIDDEPVTYEGAKLHRIGVRRISDGMHASATEPTRDEALWVVREAFRQVDEALEDYPPGDVGRLRCGETVSVESTDPRQGVVKMAVVAVDMNAQTVTLSPVT